MWSIPTTSRPRLCTICTAVAPEAVFTRHERAHPGEATASLSNHIPARNRSSQARRSDDYTAMMQLRSCPAFERDDLPRTPRTAGPRGHRWDGDDGAVLAYASGRPDVSMKPTAGVLGFGLTVV